MFFSARRDGGLFVVKEKRKSKTESSKKVDEGLNRDLPDYDQVIDSCLGA